MAGRLQDKVAIVTGAGASGPGWGNGKATAVHFARAGARVLGLDVNADAIAETSAIVADEGHAFTAHVADVRDEGAVADAVAACIAHYGGIDILVNNVGIFEAWPLDALTPAEWQRQMATNVESMFLLCRATLPRMVEQGRGGAIVNVASIAAIRYNGADYGAYATSKAANLGFSRHIAHAYARHGIRSNALLPGLIATPLVLEPLRRRLGADAFEKAVAERAGAPPLGRAGTAWDVAKAALFLASDDAAYITGTELVVDGGLSCQFG